MASKTTGRRRWTLAVCAVLVGIVVLAVAFQGAPQFTGPRTLIPPGPVLTGAPEPRSTGTTGPQDPQQVVRIDLSWVLFLIIALAIVAIVAALWRLLRRRKAVVDLPSFGEATAVDVTEAPRAPESEPEPEQVRRGLDRASVELAEAREPRDAIERAWVGLEEGAADSGVRRLPAETPAEFAARVVARVAADRHAAERFLALYLRARFSSAPVTAEDVENARGAVETLRASWSTTSPPRQEWTSAERFGPRP